MYHSITFTNSSGVSKNTWSDWHLIPDGRPTISVPAMKTKTLDIPGGHGVIDLSTSLTGYPLFENRSGKLTFYVVNYRTLGYTSGYKTWVQRYSEIVSFLHGQEIQMVLEDNTSLAYVGRVTVDSWDSGEDMSKISLNYNLKPFARKTTRSSSTEIIAEAGTYHYLSFQPSSTGAMSRTGLKVTLSGHNSSGLPVGISFGTDLDHRMRYLLEANGEYDLNETMPSANAYYTIYTNPAWPVNEASPYGPSCSTYSAYKEYGIGDYVTRTVDDVVSAYRCKKETRLSRSMVTGGDNPEWTAIESSNKVLEYKPTTNYAPGRYCRRGIGVYLCTTQTTPSTPFDSTKWQDLGQIQMYQNDRIYNVGEYCLHGTSAISGYNYLYRRKNDMTEPETWTASNWDLVTGSDGIQTGYPFKPTTTYEIGAYRVYPTKMDGETLKPADNCNLYLSAEKIVPEKAFTASDWSFFCIADDFDQYHQYVENDYVISPNQYLYKATSHIGNIYHNFNASEWDSVAPRYGNGTGRVVLSWYDEVL